MNNTEKISLPELVTKLQKEDKNYAVLSKAVLIVYLILIPLYLLIGIMKYRETGNLIDFLWEFFSVAGFLCFIFLFRKLHNLYNNVDYSLPTLQMLKQAVYRYKPFQKESIWAFFGLILMDIGMSSQYIAGIGFWEFQLYFMAIMIFAIAMGLIFWHIKYKKLRDASLNLIIELEAD